MGAFGSFWCSSGECVAFVCGHSEVGGGADAKRGRRRRQDAEKIPRISRKLSAKFAQKQQMKGGLSR